MSAITCYFCYREGDWKYLHLLPNGVCWLCPDCRVSTTRGKKDMPSVLKDWVQNLGLRHQGTLLTAVRGCDTAPKDDPSKLLIRCLRAEILNAHCGDNMQARTFIEAVDMEEMLRRFNLFRKSHDHYPMHYFMHVLHAIEIIGYKAPSNRAGVWKGFYVSLCNKLHLNVETERELDQRLNADEETFASRDYTCDGTPKCPSPYLGTGR